MISTTREQAERLLAIGVDPKTADMCYRPSQTLYGKRKGEVYLLLRDSAEVLENSDTPAWSLSALLSLIPHVIEVYDDGDYYFSLAQEFPASEEYHAAYKYCWADDDALAGKRSSCPIEACVQLIEWLIAAGYQLNTNQQ